MFASTSSWLIFTEKEVKGFGFITVIWRSSISIVTLFPKIISSTRQAVLSTFKSVKLSTACKKVPIPEFERSLNTYGSFLPREPLLLALPSHNLTRFKPKNSPSL